VLYSCQSHYKIEEKESNRNPQDFTSISMENFNFIFSSPCQWQCELLPSLGVRRLPVVAMPINGSGLNEQSL
jgi:hypothetical protein